MQTIRHTYKNIHHLFDDMERLYHDTSEREYRGGLIEPVYDTYFYGIVNYFNEYGGTHYNFNYADKYENEKLDLPEYDDNNIIVLFSGGKDSTATALYYKEHHYNVYLYHVKGINKSYPDEWKQAQKIADYLHLPLFIDEFSTTGNTDVPDHPMKNMIIANGALHYGIRENIGIQIAPGNYTNNHLEAPAFYYCGNDCREMWWAYEDAIRRLIPDFEIQLVLENTLDTMVSLADDLKLTELCLSCVGAQRFRAWNKQRIESKYNIKLFENRCGTCWKCAIEYIYLCDMHKLPYNEEYYKHCLDVIKKMDKKEHGTDFTTWKNLWDGYMLYPIEKILLYKITHDDII